MPTVSDAHSHPAHIANAAAVILTATCEGLAGKPEQTDLVFYHGSNCPDGFAAAYAAWVLRGDAATYVAVEHPCVEASLPSVKGKHVVVVDYAFSAAITQRMLGEAASFTVLDHHASAVKELAELPEAHKVLEMLMSGATLSWSYFHAGKPMPLFFRYLEDKDIWRWAFQGSEAFSTAYSAQRPTFEGLQELHAKGAAGVDALIEKGEVILAYRNGVRDSHVKRAVPCTLLGLGARFKARCVNASTLASEIGNAICKDGAELAVVWMYDLQKRHYYVSLRSDSDEVDVSLIAKALGGGGHRRASGFTCESLEGVLCVCRGARRGEKRPQHPLTFPPLSTLQGVRGQEPSVRAQRGSRRGRGSGGRGGGRGRCSGGWRRQQRQQARKALGVALQGSTLSSSPPLQKTHYHEDTHACAASQLPPPTPLDT